MHKQKNWIPTAIYPTRKQFKHTIEVCVIRTTVTIIYHDTGSEIYSQESRK